MNKNIRVVVVVAVLIVIAIIAGSQTVWSKTGQNAPAAQPSTSNSASPSISASNVGSVEAPPSVVEVTGSNHVSVGGIATLTGSSSNLDVKAVTSPREGNFLSKTITLYFTGGEADLCFAAPNGGIIYFQLLNSTTWTALPTTVTDGVACVNASTTGNYAFGN